MARRIRGMSTVQRKPVPSPQASIDTKNQSRRKQADPKADAGPDLEAIGQDAMGSVDRDADNFTETLARLYVFAATAGNICDQLDPGVVSSLGVKAVREWRQDESTIEKWRKTAEKGLDLAAQEHDEDDEKSYPWEGASDVHYPILTQASQQWAARAYPELIKGDKTVGVKVFTPPAQAPVAQMAATQPGAQMGHNGGPPMNAAVGPPGGAPPTAPPAGDPQGGAPGGPPAAQTPGQGQPPPQVDPQAQAAAQAAQMAQQQEAQQAALMKAREARAQRVAHYLNWTLFYKMDDWEGETDTLLSSLPIPGMGFKKIYWAEGGLQSDYVSPLRLTVANTSKSIYRTPRVTHDYDVYPYEIDEAIASGRYNDVVLPTTSMDEQEPRLFIEQHRLEDLDGDGYPEPYIVTVDVDTMHVMSIQPAYDHDDIIIDVARKRVVRIERIPQFATFKFLPDPKGGFYATGFAKLLDTITDTIDTSINQLMDAGSAEIAGGGFIGGNLRLQGSGQTGNLYFRPGEYQSVSMNGSEIRDAIYERTTPHPSSVTLQLMEMLLAAAKDIASVKDVITGDTPATAPVGTTLALQSQALQVFSSIYKRVYRGFKEEFTICYHTLRKYADARVKKEYAELTGGDFDADFAGDGTDIQPVADPSVVTKMQKLSRIQTLTQLAEGPVGQAAGMTQPAPAQAIIMEALDVLDIDRPERFIAEVPPNPLQAAAIQAKTADMQATAQLKTAQAAKSGAAGALDHAKALREVGLAAMDTHHLAGEADRIRRGGHILPPSEEGIVDGTNPQPPGSKPDTASPSAGT